MLDNGAPRALTDQVFRTVQPDSLYERPIPRRHRLVFYLGHLEAFDRNLLAHEFPEIATADSDLDRLFAFGIDPEAGGEPIDEISDWPTLQEIAEYSERTRQIVDCAWNDAPMQLQHVAVEHRLMHAETLSYLLHNMDPARLVAPAQAEDVPSGDLESAGTVAVPRGDAWLGQTSEGAFGWDNEFAPSRVEVPPFRIDRFPVTNGEYLRFVDSGTHAPPFWIRRGSEWRLRRMFDDIPLPLDWPVWVTHKEASTYATWAGAKLPTEQQWVRAAGTGSAWNCGNLDFGRYDPCPVDSHPRGASELGVEDIVGNGWEWTSTLFRPFKGFERFPFYPGYSAPFFDDHHYVLKGASPVTPRKLVRPSFRNWFRDDYPYVFAKFRCVR